MEISDKEFKQWSRIGSRAAFGIAALELGATVDDLIILSGDTSTSAGLERFKKTYPEKFQDVGIAEQNMMGIAAGLASEGETVYTATFAPFQTMRCCEQIKVNLGYMKHKVCFVGLASGLVLGNLGYTHCSIEDIGIIRSIPGISIISPADGLETVKALEAAINYETSCYLRLTGISNNPIIYSKDYKFEIGKSIKLKEGKDITIICCGAVVHECLRASEILETNNVSCKVINMHTIKPLDISVIDKAVASSKLIVSIEEHSVIGGLGGAIAQYKTGLKNAPPQLIIGLPDKFGKVGDHNYLLEKYGLKAKQIAVKIMKQYQLQTKSP